MFPRTDASTCTKLSSNVLKFLIFIISAKPIEIVSNDFFPMISQYIILQKKIRQMHHLSIVKTIISLVLQYNAVMLQTIKIIDAYILIFQTMTKNLMCQALMIWFPRMKQIRITRNIWRGKNYRPEEFRDLISPIRNNWLNLLGIFF